MPIKSFVNDWQKILWKILRNPTFDVVAAIVVVMFAAWIVIATETENKNPSYPVLFGRK